jgi:glycolate oxidase subunit GlcD
MTVPALVLDALAAIVGPRHVRLAAAELETFAADGLPTHRSRPAAVVVPGHRDELVRVVRVLAHHGVPFVARGAGTGLSGGALGGPDSVVLALTRLNRILAVDAENRIAVVEPGVVNARLSEAVQPLGLHYAPDPSSQAACTLGGNVAENAGGPHCFKYGVTTNHVVALEVVLPTGEVVQLGAPSGDTWGPDLVGVFVGSEGTFGIATRITLRLTPSPKEIRTLLADFTALRPAGEAVSAIVAAGLVPAALEMIDAAVIAVVEASIYAAGYPTDAAAVLLVELDGADVDAVERECAQAERLLREHGARHVRIARDPGERERLWQGRKKAFGAMGRTGKDLVVQDAVVPRSALPDVLERIAEIGRAHGIAVGNVFHAGDGNLHPNLLYDASVPSQVDAVRRASAAIMEMCIAAGGTITGEHGVGNDKQHYMPLVYDGDTLAAMQAVRTVFDPAHAANPGKVIPVHACREWAGRPQRSASAVIA